MTNTKNEVITMNAENQVSETELSREELNEVSGGIGLLGAAAIVGGFYAAGRVYGYFTRNKVGVCR